MAKTQTKNDEFKATVKSALWTQFTGGSATFTYGSTGAQVNFPASTTSSTDGDLTSATTYSLVDSYAQLKVLSVSGAGATHTDNTFRLKVDASNFIEIFYEAGTLWFSKTVATAKTNLASVAYDSVAHLYWRLRENSGTTFWETSPDNLTWTVQASQLNPLTLTTLSVMIGGICFGVDASPAIFKWSNYNMPTGLPVNYQFLKVGDGISVSEKIR